ncbi:MAG: metalloregulator ArsR/SmtB family transcription factor [Gammaproteobacteria bacterium]
MNDQSHSHPDDAALTADALKAMGHPLRWKILCVLGDKEITVGELAKSVGTTQSNMSQHLDQLRSKRIVVSRKEANRIYYRVRNEALLELISSMRSVLCHTNLSDTPPA